MDARETLHAVVERLSGIQQIVLVPSKESVLAYIDGLGHALGPDLRNYGEVTSADAPQPPPLGITNADGFLPCVFTSQDAASAYAKARGLTDAGAALVTITRGGVSAIGEFLAGGCAGFVLDPETPGAIVVDRAAMGQVFATLRLEALFADIGFVHVLRANGNFHTERTPDGARQVVVYDSAQAGAAALQRLRAGATQFDLQEVETYKFVRLALDSGLTRLVVNFTLDDERAFDEGDMRAVLARIERRAQAQQPPETHIEPGHQDSPDATMHACFASLRQAFEDHRMGPREFVAAFAAQMTVHVPVYGEAVKGRTWPQFQTDPTSPDQRMCAVFTRASEIRRTLAGVRPEFRRFATLSGFEALRWIWSMPSVIESVAVDYAQDEALKFPIAWAKWVLFPAEDLALPGRLPARGTGSSNVARVFAEAARLAAAGTVGPPDVGRLAAAHPCYWFGLRPRTGGGFDVVTHDERAFSLFSSEERATTYIGNASNLRDGGFRPRAAMVRWDGDSVFDHALRGFGQAVIDPERPGTPTGLHLDRAALTAALQRIEERLMPRFAGFQDGEPGLASA